MTYTEQYWARPRVFLRWMMTQWCNYACAYCDQDHSRKQTYKGGAGHWADAAPVNTWIGAFLHHFHDKLLNFSISGGEPLLDRKNTEPLLEFFEGASFVETVQIDTNGSVPWHRAFGKVQLMVSYHPSQEYELSFIRRVGELAAKWQVLVVNLVLEPNVWREPQLNEFAKQLPALLQLLPMDGDLSRYSPYEVAMLKARIPKKDWDNRIKQYTHGKPCLFPSVAYEMEPNGAIKVGCHKETLQSIFHANLIDRFEGYTPCPKENCFCIDKFSFLQEMGDVELPIVSQAKRLSLV